MSGVVLFDPVKHKCPESRKLGFGERFNSFNWMLQFGNFKVDFRCRAGNVWGFGDHWSDLQMVGCRVENWKPGGENCSHTTFGSFKNRNLHCSRNGSCSVVLPLFHYNLLCTSSSGSFWERTVILPEMRYPETTLLAFAVLGWESQRQLHLRIF